MYRKCNITKKSQKSMYLIPEVKAASDCNHREEDARHDQEADLDVGEQEECEEEDTDEA